MVWNMMWCEICYDVECGCGVEVVYVGWCEMWWLCDVEHVLRDVM